MSFPHSFVCFISFNLSLNFLFFFGFFRDLMDVHEVLVSVDLSSVAAVSGDDNNSLLSDLWLCRFNSL